MVLDYLELLGELSGACNSIPPGGGGLLTYGPKIEVKLLLNFLLYDTALLEN